MFLTTILLCLALTTFMAAVNADQGKDNNDLADQVCKAQCIHLKQNCGQLLGCGDAKFDVSKHCPETCATSSDSPTQLPATTLSTPASCTPPCLYITNITSVLRLRLNSTTGKRYSESAQAETLFQSSGHIRSLEIDSHNKKVFWGDFRYHTINCSDLDGGNRKSVLTYAIGYAQGISADWTSNNVYWTDSLMHLVEVADYEGKHRKVLFALDKESEPRGILANPKSRHLFWTDWGKEPKIERSTLHGTDRVAIVTKNLTWPNDLAIDHTSERLYWVDAKYDYLYSVDYDGKNMKLHYELMFNQGIVHPYSLAYSTKNHAIYLSDWQTDRVYVDTLMDGHNVTSVFQNRGKQKNIGQIRLHEDYTDAGITKPCATNRCSHMCFNAGQTYKCGCPTGWELSSDDEVCVESKRSYEIYFADSFANTVNHLVKYEGQDGFSIKPLPNITHEGLQSPLALDFDSTPDSRYVYWADHKKEKVYRMHENGGKFETLITGQVTYGLAIDKINKLLYWFKDNKDLVVSSVTGEDIKTMFAGLHSPRDIALYEEKGLIFFNDHYDGRIYRINADGTGLKSYKSTRKTAITGIAVDKIENRLYWCDSESYSIQSIDISLVSSTRKLVVQKTTYFYGRFWLVTQDSHVVEPFDLSISGDQMFWTDTYKRAIFSADKRSGGRIDYVTGGLDHPRDLHVVKDIAVNESKIIYKISHLMNIGSSSKARCFTSCAATTFFKSSVKEPEKCPVGYKQTNYGVKCAEATDSFGANFKCKCKDWMSCAQRGFSDVYGCPPQYQNPVMLFKVRECKQTVKPGYCPYDEKCVKMLASAACKNDDDCAGENKCCLTTCGSPICQKPLQKSDHACTVRNGGCSHHCVVGPSNGQPKCLCPDKMYLEADGKTCTDERPVEYVCPANNEVGACIYDPLKNCLDNKECNDGKMCCSRGCGSECVQSIQKSCKLEKDSGPCRAAITKWYFNSASQRCEKFTYGGCNGNLNRFDTELECRTSCTPEDKRNICYKPKDAGPCEALQSSYYFNSITNRCEKFSYGGCKGNENRFTTLEKCQKTCHAIKPRKLCTSNPCKNGGSCTESDSQICKCPKYFAGKYCEINAESNIVKMVLESSTPVTVEEFKETMKKTLIDYCEDFKCESKSDVSKKRKRRRSVPVSYIKDIVIFDFITDNKRQTVTFAVLYADKTGQLTTLSSAHIKEGISTDDDADHLFNAQTGKIQFLDVSTPRGRTRSNSRVNLAVGLIIACIILVILVMAAWYIKKKRLFTKEAPTTCGANELGPVSFENRLYDDLHSDKVQLPESNNRPAVEQNHYTTPQEAGVSTSLGEYASPMPLPATLGDYAEIAGAKFPPAEGATVGAVYEEPDIKKAPPQRDWVQFTDDGDNMNKPPITDFVTPQYTDPYDLGKYEPGSLPSYPPSYRSSPPETPSHSVSLADMKNADYELPDIDGDINKTTPRLSNSPIKNLDNNNKITLESTRQFSVTSNDGDHTEA
ncbi:low-density lipoprotein receptor-related protein 1-like isoform X2 [Clytia hemisphaerica]|uniref:Uncharacterized protein n=1 Tax=Clytia hemisphaerica TaxID=252671 RepID=A0A7M6DK70_9CNID